MTTASKPLGSSADEATDTTALRVGIAAALPPLTPRPALRARVLERARASMRAHREYLTVRREDGSWESFGLGCRRRRLRDDAGVQVDLLRLDAGAEVPWHEEIGAQEILVVDGCLVAAADDAPPFELPRLSHVVRTRERRIELRAGDEPVMLYVRHVCSPAALPRVEAAWWSAGASVARAGARHWREAGSGVEALALRAHGDVVSMLVRCAAGASVPDHGHAVDEDCLVLDGELYLGDILLRPGDYQLAPAGGSHFGECSDVGVLFFFHGALDERLKGASR